MILIILLISLLIHTATAQDNQYFRDESTIAYSPMHQDPLRLFCQPIKFTQSGIQHYLHNIYSHPAYARDFLPHSLSDFIQFLNYGKNTNQSRLFMVSTFRLFLNKVKATPYLSAYAFCDMLDQLPLLKDYCINEDKNYVLSLQKTLKNIFFSFFLSKFNFFKENPDQFFDDISNEIINAVESKSIKREVECEQLRQIIIRFLENCFHKLIWSPFDQEEVWISVKNISFKLTSLMENGIICAEELDDLFKSLLESFCHFLNITGSELSPDVIEMIKEDISNGNLLLLTLEEQEDTIESKPERLMRALIKTDAKIQARLQGFITESIRY